MPIATALVGASILAPRWTQAQRGLDRPTLAFTHVTVIDVATGASHSDQTLVIAGNRISRLGPSATTSVPRGASVVDASGRFVIPGLWDMHVHLFAHAPPVAHDERLPLFVANGVTGVRSMWTTLEDIRTVRGWRRDEVAGALLAPRVVAGSTIIDGPGSYWPTALVVTSAAQARRVVDSLAQGGAEFIKVYTDLGRDAYFAIADETKRLGIPFAGHLPLSITAAEASDAGQKSIEHLGFMDDCSTARDQIVRARKDTAVHVEGGVGQLSLSTYSDSLCGALFRRFVQNGTWQGPTMSVLRMSGLTLDSALALQPYLEYATAEERASWERASRSITPQRAALRRRGFQKNLEVVAAMQRAGVPILAGTDVGNPWIIAGYSLHAELAIFVQAGMQTLAALQTATINPARYLGALDSLGTIEHGKIADIVLLDANPLADIRNVDRIRAVVLNGRLLTRSVLDSVLAVARRRTR